jgi:quercetin dioxygenase-like cupin family protein
MKRRYVMRGTEGRSEMKKSVLVWTAALLTVGAIGFGTLPLAAQVPPPPIAAEILTPRSVFPDDVDMKIKIKTDGRREVVKVVDPSRTVTGRFTVQPGARFPWHTHAGPVVVNVVEGTLVYVETDCSGQAYPAGTAFVDPGHGHVHSAFNPTGGETVFVATFFEAPPEPTPLLIPADTPDCAA